VPFEKIRRPIASVLEAVEEEVPREVEAGMGIRELVAALRRRAALILSVTAVLAVVSIVVAIVLPPTYRSSATIRIQEQEVPPDLVRDHAEQVQGARMAGDGRQDLPVDPLGLVQPAGLVVLHPQRDRLVYGHIR